MGSNISLKDTGNTFIAFQRFKLEFNILKEISQNYPKKYFDLNTWFKWIRFKIPDRISKENPDTSNIPIQEIKVL